MGKLKIRTRQPWIAYPGSTIQQNFGETTEKGFLLWDVESRDNFDVKFHAIPNPCPFITIDWCGSVRQTIENASKHLVTRCRIRVRSNSPIMQAEIRQLYNELREFYDPVEIVMKIDNIEQTSLVDHEIETLINENLRDRDTLVSLMSDFLNAPDISESDWEFIRSVIGKHLLGLSGDSDIITRHAKWSVRNLEFDNTFSFGRKNIINFDKLNGIVGIFAPNARGKSSIIGTLMYALFNATDRGPIKNLHIINTRKGECSATATIRINEIDYKVGRKTVKKEPKKGFIHGVTSLEFHKVDPNGNSIENATGEVRTDTEKEIRKLIGTADDFLMTSLASQGDINRFINEGATQRKSILARMLDLDILENISNAIKEESSFIKAQLKQTPERDWETVISGLKNVIFEEEQSLINIETKLTVARTSLAEAQLNRAKFDVNNTITQADIEGQEAMIVGLEHKHADLVAKIKSLRQTRADAVIKLENILAFKTNFPIEALRSQKKILDDQTKVLVGMQHSLSTEQKTLEFLEKSIQKLAEVPCGNGFPTCKFIKDSHLDSQKIDMQRERVAELTRQVIATKDALEKIRQQEIDVKLEKYASVLRKESELTTEIEKSDIQISGLERDCENMLARLSDSRARLIDMSSHAVTGDIASSIDRAKRDVADWQLKCNTLDARRVTQIEKVTKARFNFENRIEEQARYIDLKNKWRLYEHMFYALSRRGIPSQIIHRLLPAINAEILKILQGVVDFTVSLEVDTESNSMDIYIDYGDSRRIIELASGMEKMIASLAIRVALINVSSLPKTDMLIIDEGFGTLDESNIAACARLLESFKQWFRLVIVISHVDGIKDIADSIIELTRYEKDSRVIFT